MSIRAWALVGLPSLLGCLLCTASANADVTGWAQLGGGVLAWQAGEDGSLAASPTMAIDAGVGSSPRSPFILGGYFKVMPVFGEGVDLGLLARFANRGFQTDYIGFALDAGLYQRFWGMQSTGFMGQVVLGLPLGFQLAGLGMAGSNSTFGFGASLGIDLVRLTVDRQHLLEWWPNPRPSDNMFTSDIAGGATRF